MPLFQPGLAVLGDQPNAQPLPTPQFTNAYSITLTAGESVSIVASDLHGSDISFELDDSSGNLIALSSPGGKSFAQGITDFVSASGGTYVILVTGGTSGDQYNLVVTENAGFDTQSSTQTSPQPLPPSGTVLARSLRVRACSRWTTRSTPRRSRSTRRTQPPAPSARRSTRR